MAVVCGVGVSPLSPLRVGTEAFPEQTDRDPAPLHVFFLSRSEAALRAGGVGMWAVWSLSGLGSCASSDMQIKVLIRVVGKTRRLGRPTLGYPAPEAFTTELRECKCF